MNSIGIDIGSTCTKAAVLDEHRQLIKVFAIPTGWSSFNALETAEKYLLDIGIDVKSANVISTGYGRKAVTYARKAITEITCHAKGAAYLFGETEMNIIDVGGQDTKVITVTRGNVSEFFMNDKCSAGTGKFIEVMANRLNLPLDQLAQSAANHTEEIKISSMCTVFAETEIITMVGQGASRENIAWGILNSIAAKVAQEYAKLSEDHRNVYLTGGLCDNDYFCSLLSQYIGREIKTVPNARYAGAIGAAVLAGRFESHI